MISAQGDFILFEVQSFQLTALAWSCLAKTLEIHSRRGKGRVILLIVFGFKSRPEQL
ncbi:hypothetical protein HMPREF1557_01165 [Streptococcus sobrinus W1703]|uniref:Uncharacterized protein n=1 Tax=Streptococcus sobrinus W1703 TaxID=1227275 RepID=U2KMY2_9STRE|nr:hypothetical protein HMPREF1557_01165 [Streptococcus sobrinus W1703]